MRAAGVMPRGTPGSATIAYTTSLPLHGQVLIFSWLASRTFFIGGRALSGVWAVVVQCNFYMLNIECSAAGTTRKTLAFKRICVSSCTVPFGSRRGSLAFLERDGSRSLERAEHRSQDWCAAGQVGGSDAAGQAGGNCAAGLCLIMSFCMKFSIFYFTSG